MLPRNASLSFVAETTLWLNSHGRSWDGGAGEAVRLIIGEIPNCSCETSVDRPGVLNTRVHVAALISISAARMSRLPTHAHFTRHTTPRHSFHTVTRSPSFPHTRRGNTVWGWRGEVGRGEGGWERKWECVTIQGRMGTGERRRANAGGSSRDRTLVGDIVCP